MLQYTETSLLSSSQQIRYITRARKSFKIQNTYTTSSHNVALEYATTFIQPFIHGITATKVVTNLALAFSLIIIFHGTSIANPSYSSDSESPVQFFHSTACYICTICAVLYPFSSWQSNAFASCSHFMSTSSSFFINDQASPAHNSNDLIQTSYCIPCLYLSMGCLYFSVTQVFFSLSSVGCKCKSSLIVQLNSYTNLDSQPSCSGRGWCRLPSVWLRMGTGSVQVASIHGGSADPAIATLGSRLRGEDPSGGIPEIQSF